MNKRVLYWTSAFVLLLVTFWFGYFHKTSKPRQAEQIVPVEVEAVGTAGIEETIELSGWIQAKQIVDVKSKVSGRVESLESFPLSGEGSDLQGGKRDLAVPVEEGLEVRKGQQLAVIDHDVYLSQVAAAGADLQAKQVELADAERERKRMVGLYEAGSATEQSSDKAITAAELAAARLALARANLELAQINLRESMIVSPIDGVVTKKYVDEGNLVNVGEKIVTVADIKTVKIIVSAAERDSTKIDAGTPVRIMVDAFGEKEFNAGVYSVYPALDEQTHTVQVEIRMDNGEMLLKPGMFARVTLVTKHKEDVVVIPRDVVLGGKVDEPYVYVVEDGVARKRIVKVGITQSDRCEISDGLKADETVVVNGMNFLIDGTGVEIVRIEDIK